MPSLTSCIAKAGPALPAQDKADILRAARQYRNEGMDAQDAAVRAIEEQLTKANQELAVAEKDYDDERRVRQEAGGGAPGVAAGRAGDLAGQDGNAGPQGSQDPLRGEAQPAQEVDPQALADLADIDEYRAEMGEASSLVVVPPQDVQAGLARAIGTAFSNPVYFVQNELGMTPFNGVTINDRIYVAADADMPSVSLAMHEVTHNLPEDIRAAMVDAVMETVSPVQMDSFLRQYPAYARLPEDQQREELVTRIIEQDSMNPGFWLALHRKLGATQFGRLVRSILGTLDKIISGFAKTDSSEFTTNIKRVREVVAGAYAEAIERQNGKEDPNSPAALERDRRQAAAYASEHGILPFVPGPVPGVPLQGAELARKPLFSIKEIKLTGKNKMDLDPATGLPLNKSVNGAPRTVTLYYPTTKDKARQIVASKTLPAVEGSNRVYLTNESQAFNLLGPGGVGQATDGSGVMIMIDPALLHLHNEFPNGRKDFFIPTDTGGYSQRKDIKLWSLLAPNTEAIDPTATNVRLREDVAAAVAEWQGMSKKQKTAALKEAEATLSREHNVSTLLGENGKLQKTRAGGYGLTYDDKSVASMGLGLASAQNINGRNFNTCPFRAICEALCLGDTSGQNLLYGGAADLAVAMQRGTDFRAGPRLSQFLKTQAFIVNTKAFTFKLQSEIEAFERWCAKDVGTEIIKDDDGNKVTVPKQVYKPAIRLNVTSDIDPEVWKPMMDAMRDIMFYDYTKLGGDAVADNHHLTYSSTGGSQTVAGVRVYNKYSNWNQRLKKLRAGKNVAMAFSDSNSMPEFIIDEASGEKFQVWNGDNYDARFLDPKEGAPGNLFGKGMVIGLTNKDRTKAKITKYASKARVERGTPAEWGEVLDRYAATVDGQEDRSVPLIREWLRKQSGQLTIGEFNAFAGHPSVRSVGFFVDYDPKRDGDTVVMRNQDSYGDGPGGRKVLPIKAQFSERAAKAQTETPAFKAWFGDSKVVDADGKPRVVYHGTTNDFTTFDNAAANIESDLGAGFYFSSEPEDVANNYAGEGPDLTNKIEQLAERIESDSDDISMEQARQMARERLSQSKPNTMPVYLSIKNPVVLGGDNETFFDYNEEYNEELDEYGEPTGALVDVVEALRNVPGSFVDFDPEKVIADIFEKSMGDGLKATELFNAMKQSSGMAYAMDDDSGALASTEIIRQAFAEAGYDGYIDNTVDEKFGSMSVGQKKYGKGMKGMNLDTVHYVAFRPQQIKSAIGNRGTFDNMNADIRFSERAPKPTDVSPIGFYSELARRAEQGPGSGTAQAWKDFFRGQTTKGVKAEEIEWSGINEWLDLQQAQNDALVRRYGPQDTIVDGAGNVIGKSQNLKKITKAQVGEYLKANGVQVTETVLEGEPDLDKWIPEDSDEQYGPSPANPAKFARYTIPGGKNYREVLLTLPDGRKPAPEQAERMEVVKRADGNFDVVDKDGVVKSFRDWGEATAYAYDQQLDENIRRNMAWEKSQPPMFKSGHWDQPNVLAHIRMNDRIDADGKRVLFVEEIQSDWGQAGKKQGFQGSAAKQEMQARRGEGFWRVDTVGGEFVTNVLDSDMPNATADMAIAEARTRLANAPQRTGRAHEVPNAPFVTATDKWVALAMKRIIKMAVDGGYDKVAFVNGDQSAERYDLSKQISAIRWTKTDNGYGIKAMKEGQSVVEKDGLSESELAEHVGKEVAQKIVDGVGAENMDDTAAQLLFGKGKIGLLRGLDLKVGGEGMKTFYDKIVPNVAKDVMKKVGGGSLQTVKFAGKTPRDFVVLPGIGSDITIYDNEANQWVGQLEPFRMVNDVRQAAVFSSTSMAQRSLQAVASKMPGLEQPGFEITDAMRGKVSSGLPMFSERKPKTYTPLLKRIADNTGAMP